MWITCSLQNSRKMDALNKKIASFYKLLANRNHFLNKEVQRLHFFGSADYAIRLWPGFNRGEVVMSWQDLRLLTRRSQVRFLAWPWGWIFVWSSFTTPSLDRDVKSLVPLVDEEPLCGNAIWVMPLLILLLLLLLLFITICNLSGDRRVQKIAFSGLKLCQDLNLGSSIPPPHLQSSALSNWSLLKVPNYVLVNSQYLSSYIVSKKVGRILNFQFLWRVSSRWSISFFSQPVNIFYIYTVRRIKMLISLVQLKRLIL